MKRSTFLMLGAGALLPAQPANAIGMFEGESDIGNPEIKGSAAFDPTKKEYRLAGAGENMWAKTDQFHFVWKKLTGNVRMTATLHFAGSSAIAHRKAGLMLRKSLDAGAPYVDAVVHGDGLTSLQVRETPDDITRGFRFPVEAPVRIALERRGNIYSMWHGKPDGTLQELGSIQVPVTGDVYAGLFVCSHNPKGAETALFTDVTLEPLAATPNAKGAKKK
jgi:TolB protein